MDAVGRAQAIQSFDSTTNFFDHIPKECLGNLFEKLPLQDLRGCLAVSTKCKEIIDTDSKLTNYIKIATVFLANLKSLFFRVSYEKSISEIYQPIFHKELVNVIFSLCRPYQDKTDLRKKVVLLKLIEDFSHICPECILEIAKSWEKDGKIYNDGSTPVYYCDIIKKITQKLAQTDFKKASEFIDQCGMSDIPMFFEKPLQINLFVSSEVSEKKCKRGIDSQTSIFNHHKVTLIFYKNICMIKGEDNRVLQSYQQIQYKELVNIISLGQDSIDSFFNQILKKEELTSVHKFVNDFALLCIERVLNTSKSQKRFSDAHKITHQTTRTTQTTKTITKFYKNKPEKVKKMTAQSEYNCKICITSNISYKVENFIIENDLSFTSVNIKKKNILTNIGNQLTNSKIVL